MKLNLLPLTRQFALLGGLTVASLVPQALAITDGQLDEADHPYVGLVVAYYDYTIEDENGDPVEIHQPLWRGTGTLISPRVVVTAGHVVGVEPGGLAPTSMAVYFESDVNAAIADGVYGPGAGEPGDPIRPGPGTYPFQGGHAGTPYAHPEWNGFLTLPNSHDVGVVVLDEPVIMDHYAKLPDLGVLDSLATKRGLQNSRLDVVGYGVQYIRQNPKRIIKLQAELARYQGVVSVINLGNAIVDGYNIFVTSDKGAGNGSGGTAFGDSGGPAFLTGTSIMVGITSFALNQNAVGPGGSFRTDTAEAQDFIYSILDMVGE